MYKYAITVSPQDAGLDFRKIETLIDAVTHCFNESSEHMRNPKKIVEYEIISNSVLVLIVESECALESVGRALRGWTAELIKGNEEFFSGFSTRSGSLLKYYNQKLISSKPALSVEEVSDADFLKAVVDYFLGNRDINSTLYRRKRDAIREMKKIALEADIIAKGEE